MKKPLDDYLKEFGEAANRASEISRNLGLGAIAAIWIFKNPENSATLLPDRLVLALMFAVVSLGTDLLHYVFKSIALYIFFRVKEKEYKNGTLTAVGVADLEAPGYIEIVTWTLFAIKILAVIIAYCLIFAFLTSKL